LLLLHHFFSFLQFFKKIKIKIKIRFKVQEEEIFVERQESSSSLAAPIRLRLGGKTNSRAQPCNRSLRRERRPAKTVEENPRLTTITSSVHMFTCVFTCVKPHVMSLSFAREKTRKKRDGNIWILWVCTLTFDLFEKLLRQSKFFSLLILAKSDY
jgi:hypothetical protein